MPNLLKILALPEPVINNKLDNEKPSNAKYTKAAEDSSNSYQYKYETIQSIDLPSITEFI